MISQLAFCLAIGAVLFTLGAVGFLTRRNLILIMLSAELMLHGVGLNLVGASRLVLIDSDWNPRWGRLPGPNCRS